MNLQPTPQKSAKPALSSVLEWLADAPLYINTELLENFYDAVVRPENKQGKTTLEVNDEKTKALKVSSGIDISAEASTGDLFAKIAGLFPSIKLGGKGSVAGAQDTANKSGKKSTVELFPIDTPQRQLVHLTLTYLFRNPDRLLLVDNPSEEDWRKPDHILESPRCLVFIDLPSQTQAETMDWPLVRLIPTAAEFVNGTIVPMYDAFKDEKGCPAPPYPELNKKDQSGQELDNYAKLLTARKDYWNWFANNHSSKKAMRVVEDIAGANGRMRWIDYRLPIAKDGSTLHLHFSAAEKYSIGDFAYNLISRGMKHGLRIVGTLKSEPAINVLAVFEK